MLRYRHASRLPVSLGLLLVVAGCSVPTQRQTLDATARLVAKQVVAPIVWRLDPEADAAARQRVEALLVGGLTLEECIEVSFLASPDLQLVLEEVEISRAEFIAATTMSNPVFFVGSREPSGALGSFYPDRTITLGVLQSVVDLLKIPGLRAVASRDLERARHDAANTAVTLAARVAQAWIEYSAAVQALDLHQRALAIVQRHYDNLVAESAGVADGARTLEAPRRELLGHRAEVIRAQLVVARSRTALGERLGIAGWRDDWSVEQRLPALPEADPDASVEEQAAMERRLDLQAGKQAIDARLHVLANQRRFRWLNQLDIGVFRDQATGGTAFVGPNLTMELPIFDQRVAALLKADSMLRSEMRTFEASRLAARAEIRRHAAEVSTFRQLLEQIEQEIAPGQRQLLAGSEGGNPDDEERLGLRLAALKTELAGLDLLMEYWRARSALALASGDWGALSGLQ